MPNSSIGQQIVTFSSVLNFKRNVRYFWFLLTHLNFTFRCTQTESSLSFYINTHILLCYVGITKVLQQQQLGTAAVTLLEYLNWNTIL